MPRNGSGTYSLPAGNPVVSGQTISSTAHNTTNSDIASALTASLAKDGQTTAAANLPMGSFRHTGVGDATARNQYGVVGQIQDGTYQLVNSVTGTNTVAGSLAPVISAYTAGMQVVLIPANANSGAATLNLNGAGALDIQKYTSAGQVALAANDLRAGIPALLILDTGGDDWILLNPYSGALGDVTIGTLTATTINASGTVTAGALSATNLTITNINGVAAPVGANPSASLGLSAVNGSAVTFMRSDGAPALSQAIAPTWTSLHKFSRFTGSGTGLAIGADTTTPGMYWRESGANTDNKTWEILAVSEQWRFRAINDANDTAGNIMLVDRTGTTIDSIALTSTALTWNGNAVLSSTSNLNASNLSSGTVPTARIDQTALKCRNITGSSGTAVTVESDPGGTPSGSAGDVFEYY